MKRKSACLMISAGSLLAVSFILNWLPFNLWHKTITPPAYERKFEKCTTIIVGKDISSDGSVLLAHNEDLGDNAAQHYIVEPRKQYAAGTTMTTYFGAEIPQVEETFAYTATTVFEESYVPGSITSGINENQVAVVNNLAYQRDAESPEPSRGRIMWSEYTQLALERAQSAREAVQIIGNLAYTYKNYGPGSIFGVTDTDEGWWIEITQEGQWVAQKVKDDEASMRANAYAIGVVDFNDTDSFLYSEDLVDYAVYRGWYSQGEFNFTEVYASSDSISDTSNTHRQMRVNDLLTTFTPSVTPANLMSILRDHYEGTTWDSTENYTRRSPHHTSEYTVCNLDTEVSLVCQSRSWLPAEIGGVCWRAMSAPCASAYTPWYMGMQEVPTEYQRGIQRSTSNSAYWQFRDFIESVDENYAEEIQEVKENWSDIETEALENQEIFEETALSLYNQNQDSGQSFLTIYANTLALNAYSMAQGLPIDSDTTAPTVSAMIPDENAIDAPIASLIIVSFSKSMDTSTINATTFTVSDETGEIAGTITSNWLTSTFTPNNKLAYDTVYTVTLANGIKDLSGNSLDPIVYTFKTESLESDEDDSSSDSSGGGGGGGCFFSRISEKD